MRLGLRLQLRASGPDHGENHLEGFERVLQVDVSEYAENWANLQKYSHASFFFSVTSKPRSSSPWRGANARSNGASVG